MALLVANLVRSRDLTGSPRVRLHISRSLFPQPLHHPPTPVSQSHHTSLLWQQGLKDTLALRSAEKKASSISAVYSKSLCDPNPQTLCAVTNDQGTSVAHSHATSTALRSPLSLQWERGFRVTWELEKSVNYLSKALLFLWTSLYIT